MYLRKALLQSAEQSLVPIDLEVGMQPALQQNTGSAKLDGLADFVVDDVEIENVAFRRQLALQGTVKRAKRAIFRAEVRVIDIAVDDVGHDAVGMKAPAHGVGFHAYADQVVRAKKIKGLGFCQGHKMSQPYVTF